VAKLQYRLTEMLANQGYFEMVTNSLTSPKYVEKSGFLDSETTVEIYNKLSEDLGVMRQTLLFSGLEVLAHNINRRQTDLKCFEFGTVYQKKAEGGYKESRRLAIFLSGNSSAESWVAPAKPVAFSDMYATVTQILERLHVEVSQVEVIESAPFAYGLSLKLGEKVVASLGLVEDKALKLAEVRRDLSLVIDQEVSYDRVKKVAEKAGGKLLKQIDVFDVYQGDKLGQGKKAYALSFILQDQENTLKDKEIDKTMSNLIQAFQSQVGAIIRS
jgi:phenylalanyl-tRNA synthetase beta chain